MHVSVLIVRSPNAGRGEDKFACVDSLVDRLFHYAGENFDVSCQEENDCYGGYNCYRRRCINSIKLLTGENKNEKQ